MMTHKVRFGILGAGRIAQNRIAPAILESGETTLHAAASRDLARARALGAQQAYDSYLELLEDPAVEAVFITTHNGLHKELSVEALRRGKHVLCEKPLARNARECQEILSVAQETGNLLMEAFMYRYRPNVRKAQELVRGGEIGDLKTVEASFRFHMTSPNDVRLRSDWGGGALLDVGCYCVNVSRVFLGDTPTSVKAMAFLDPAHGVDRSLQGVLGFPEGRFASISCGLDSGLHQQVVLVGTEGVIKIDEPFITQAGPPALTLLKGKGKTVLDLEPSNPFRDEVEDFARAVRQGSSPLLGPEEGFLNARILDRLAEDAGLVLPD